MSRGFNTGQQPDGDFVTAKADGSAVETTTPLATDATYTSSWVDTDGWTTIEIVVNSDVSSIHQGIVLDFTDDVQGSQTIRATKKYAFNEVDIRRGFKEIRIPTLLDGFRISYTNDGVAQTTFLLSVTLRVAPENILNNSGNAQVTANFDTEVALGNISNYSSNVKFGLVDDVDTADPPCDIVFQSGTPDVYTGFNATSNGNLVIVSSDNDDRGSEVSSGTITTASMTQVIDLSATFQTDGVTAGDVFLDDAQGIYGIIKTVDSQTTLTVIDFRDGTNGEYSTNIGDSYRVATSIDTGAAVIQVQGILNSDFQPQPEQFVILNGTTNVTVTVDAYRCSRGKVISAGSSGGNEGIITNTQQGTSNVFWQIAQGSNQTLNAADTVPANKIFLIKKLKTSMSRVNGSAGSAIISFRIRQPGEVFQTKRREQITNSLEYEENLVGGITLVAGTDYKFSIESVSDNNTDFTATLEHQTIDR